MDSIESANPATRTGLMVEAVCWECGEVKTCFEYTVCCVGTLFHVCPECEERIAGSGCEAATLHDDQKTAESTADPGAPAM